MPSGPQRRRASAALIPMTALALVLAAFLSWTAPWEEAERRDATAPGRENAANRGELGLGQPEPRSAPRVAEAPAPAPAAPVTATERNLRLRFLRGSSGLPVERLGVRLLARLDDGA